MQYAVISTRNQTGWRVGIVREICDDEGQAWMRALKYDPNKKARRRECGNGTIRRIVKPIEVGETAYFVDARLEIVIPTQELEHAETTQL